MRLRTRASTTTVDPSSGTETLQLIDTALSFAARRQVFTVDEAMELFHGLQNKMRDARTLDQLTVTVAAAEDSYRTTMHVDRSQLVDQLLDLRLALTSRS